MTKWGPRCSGDVVASVREILESITLSTHKMEWDSIGFALKLKQQKDIESCI